ncbi:hypothetical protein DdX_10023 [Ditylenchus destructor]|uniref:Uncharacterized protein n=1 Tax=Ditylenchus destructor TaxID=166010 RepID=A0AAD4N4R2_9BILA|nr:hypothetical protein DdX_10023 [Ditylenchus destructor]
MLIDSLIDPACPSNVKPAIYAACQTSAEMCSESFIGYRHKLDTRRAPGRNQQWRVNELKVRELFEYTQRSFGPFEYKPNMSSSGFNNAAPSEEQPDFDSFAPDSPNSFENTSFNDQPRGSKPLRLNQQNTTSEDTSSNNPPKESVKRHESLLKNPNSFEKSSFNDKPHQTETRSDYFAKPDYQGYRQKLETQRAPGRNQMWRVNGSYDNIAEQTFNSRTKLAGSYRQKLETQRAPGRNQIGRVNGSYDNIAEQTFNSRTKLAGSRQRSRSLTKNLNGSGKFLRQALAVKEITKEKAKKIDREKRIKQLLGEDLARGYSPKEWWKLQATPNFAITENYDASPVRIPMKRAVGDSGKALKLEKKKSSADEFARNVKSEEDKKYNRFLG